MKRFKSIFAMLTAIVMVFGMCSIALANEGDATTTPNGDRTVDQTISVTDLQGTDTVKYYKVVEWVDSEGWAFANGFTGVNIPDSESEGGVRALTLADIYDGISQDEAKAISAKAGSAGAVSPDKGVLENGTWSVSKPDSGLYMVIVTAGTAGVIYNPVFVAADYNGTNETNAISIEATYGDTAVTKKETITVDKTAAAYGKQNDDASDNNVGDKVNFTIATTIPVYLDSYQNPSFKITDAVSDGLVIDPSSVVVTYGKDEDGNDKTTNATNNDLTLTPSATGITVNFKAAYLKANASPVAVTVTYQATVTNAATSNVNVDKNSVVVEYSNGPNDEKGAIGDATTHYTFSIGATLVGSQDETDKTTIIRKVEADENGNIIVETVDGESSTTTKVSPLAGATFTLYTDQACENVYKNNLYKDGAVVQSGTNGLININGLDAGTYWLKETDAPDGYIMDDVPRKIEIKPVYDDEPTTVTETIDDITVTYEIIRLKSYTVEIDGKTVATYTFTNNATDTALHLNTVNAEETNIGNARGTALPSTGGIGTTIFYIVGGVMVAGAAIFLLTKRRAAAE